jgi:hypothetical protein
VEAPYGANLTEREGSSVSRHAVPREAKRWGARDGEREEQRPAAWKGTDERRALWVLSHCSSWISCRARYADSGPYLVHVQRFLHSISVRHGRGCIRAGRDGNVVDCYVVVKCQTLTTT